MCEVKLEKALATRDLAVLRDAIDFPKKLRITGRLAGDRAKNIKTYQQFAKSLISNILHEEYVVNQLREAIESMHIDLLEAAIAAAEASHMPHVKGLSQARQVLDNQYKSRAVLNSLEIEMAKCNSVPRLLAAVDMLNPLIKDAIALGLAGEYVVQSAVNRMHKIQTLITIRNDMRRAVELCSQSRMEK